LLRIAEQGAAGLGDHYLILQTVIIVQCNERLDDLARLPGRSALDFALRVFELLTAIEKVLHGRNGAGRLPSGKTVTGIETHQFGSGMRSDLAFDVGGALERGVMDDHQLMVG